MAREEPKIITESVQTFIVSGLVSDVYGKKFGERVDLTAKRAAELGTGVVMTPAQFAAAHPEIAKAARAFARE